MPTHETPRYMHDCDNCEFVRREGKFDVYFCGNEWGGSVVARASDEPSDYLSASPMLMELTILPRGY